MARLHGPTARGVETDGAFDAAGLMRALVGRKGAILIPTALAAAAALALIVAVPARYQSVAEVLLENQESYLTRPDKAAADPAETLDEAAVQSAAEALTTPDMARKAIERLGLDGLPEFHPSWFGRLLDTMLGGTRAGTYDDIVIETFLDRLTVFPITHTRVLQIEFSSRDPALAAKTANTLADLFLQSQADARKVEAKAAADWLASRIGPLRVKVADAQSQADALRAQSGLLAGSNGVTAPTQRLTELTSQIASARAALSAAKAKAQALRDILRSGRLDAIPDVARDASISRYLEARVALKAEIAEASRILLPEHPHMRELQGQLAGLEREIREAAVKAVAADESDARIAADQVNNLNQAIADQSRAVEATDGDSVELGGLELDAKSARDQLESYLEKYREALARESDDATPPNARVIETAAPSSSPSFPKRVPTMLLATLEGFVVSLGVATARLLTEAPEGEPPEEPLPLRRREGEATSPDPSIEVPVSLATPRPRRREPAPVWGLRSPPEDEPAAVAASPPPAPRGDEPELEAAPDAEGLRPGAIDAFLDFAPRGPLVVVATGEGARGALAAALSAARRFAKRGATALVDLGATQPWLGDVVERGPDGFPGLSDVIAGHVGFDDALHPDLSRRLDVMPPGDEAVSPRDAQVVLERLSDDYPFVVVHVSDWRTPLGLMALQFADGALICARESRLAPIRSLMARAAGSGAFIFAEAPLESGAANERAA